MATVEEQARSAFRNKILRRLGSSSHSIELDNGQIDDRIEQALHKFHQFHYDGSNKGYIILEVVPGVSTYVLADTILDVTNIFGSDGGTELLDPSDPILLKPFYVGNTGDISYNIVSYELQLQQYEMIKSYFTRSHLFEWNETTKELMFYSQPTDTKLLLEVYSKKADMTRYYNNEWLLKYSAALCKEQWAMNISKYDGTVLPSGISLNWNNIQTQAEAEIEKLETELFQQYTLPYEMHIG